MVATGRGSYAILIIFVHSSEVVVSWFEIFEEVSPLLVLEIVNFSLILLVSLLDCRARDFRVVYSFFLLV